MLNKIFIILIFKIILSHTFEAISVIPSSTIYPELLKVKYNNETGLFDKKLETLIVTAISSDHFGELMGFLESIRLYLGKNISIIIFNLGLERSLIDRINNYENIFLIPFELKLYPKHYENYFNYAFKPQCVYEASLLNPKLLLWGDSSARIEPTANLSLLSEQIYNFRFGFAAYSPHVIHRFYQNDWNHPLFYKYFNIDYKNYDGMFQFAATILAFAPQHVQGQIVMKKWLECAQDIKCISPENTHRHNQCPQNQLKPTPCHRFDQSAINIIIHEYFKPTEEEYLKKIWILQGQIGRMDNPTRDAPRPFKYF